MAGSKDVTHLVERLEAFEDRLGVSLEGLYAAQDKERDSIEVNGELHPRGGTELDNDVDVVVTLYDSGGRVLETRTEYIDSDNFFGFETFSVYLSGAADLPVSKIRIYPKAG